jgi:Tfp pilus assembly PilM family ATPase
MFFSHKANAIVGVDIGTSYIKVAQISHGQQKTLDTYGIVNVSSHIDIYNNEAAIDQTASILKTLLAKAGVALERIIAEILHLPLRIRDQAAFFPLDVYAERLA